MEVYQNILQQRCWPLQLHITKPKKLNNSWKYWHQEEHSETWNKDIINIENDLRNIDTELAKQAKKMGEQMKSFGKTDSSFKKLGGIGNGLADKESLWFIVGKNEKFTGNKKNNSLNC